MDRIYEIAFHDFDGTQRISASSPAQARYRSWQHAVDAGYRVSLLDFGKWVKSVRLWNRALSQHDPDVDKRMTELAREALE